MLGSCSLVRVQAGVVDVVVLAAAMVASGCNVFDARALNSIEGAISLPDRDGGACVRADEVCNGRDDDCDGDIDEDADESCELDNAIAACGASGRCAVVSCESGFANCNERDDDGCERVMSSLACGECGRMCSSDAGPDSMDPPPDTGPGPMPDASDPPPDTGPGPMPDASDPPDTGPVCVPTAEICDGIDNDCNGEIDETAECALERCVESAPSYRGASCDQCVCANCSARLATCQQHPDATWATLCANMVECVVVETRAGNCPGGDCYGGLAANGPCVPEINLAAGGTSETDTSAARGGGCTATDPPTTACQAAIIYRDQCTATLCMAECAQ